MKYHYHIFNNNITIQLTHNINLDILTLNSYTNHMKIDYNRLTDKWLLLLVHEILDGIAKGHGAILNEIYLTFSTKMKDVIMPKKLLIMHPEKMSIFLCNNFQKLDVSSNSFTVQTTFATGIETITVPLCALTQFIDKTNSFALNFQPIEPSPEPSFLSEIHTENNVIKVNFKQDN